MNRMNLRSLILSFFVCIAMFAATGAHATQQYNGPQLGVDGAEEFGGPGPGGSGVATGVVDTSTATFTDGPSGSAPTGSPTAGGAAGTPGGEAGEGDDNGQSCTAESTESENCTSSPCFQAEQENYLLSEISQFIDEKVTAAARELFEGIIQDSGFIEAVAAALTLYVAIFAIMFLFGLVPLTLGQGIIRAVKMGALLVVISPAGWENISDTMIKFFNDGTDQLISQVIAVAADSNIMGGSNIESSHNFSGVCEGYTPGGTNTPPFCIIDVTLGKVLQPSTLVQFAGTAATGPFGLGMVSMMGLGAGAFVLALIEALKIYAISLIAKALLFGLAPIFFAALLFEKTKQIFFGWINQLVNYSLQPILLFIFFAFYITLLDQAVTDILDVELCWADFNSDQGKPEPQKWWRFCTGEGDERTCSTDWTWEGALNCVAEGDNADCQDFPISVTSMLIFALLSILAFKFNQVVPVIATELSASTVMLNRVGRESYFSGNSFQGGGRPSG